MKDKTRPNIFCFPLGGEHNTAVCIVSVNLSKNYGIGVTCIPQFDAACTDIKIM